MGTSAAVVNLTLPPTTPRGTYLGTVEIAGQALRFQVEVEPHTRLAVHPPGVTLRLKPGARASAELTVVNEGNAPAEIQRSDTVNFDDDDAFDHGLDAAVHARQREGQRRVDVFFDELARSSGGTARLEVEDGAGALAPGEARSVQVRFSVPKEVRVGHTYTGSWKIGDAAFTIQLEVPNSSRVTAREVSS
jgi:hypothetical protein